MEIVADRPTVDLVLAPVGGGGLLSGVAAAVKLTRPGARVIGVEPELAADAADGRRSQSVGVLNFAHRQAFVDDVITVTEAEIREAMRRIIFATRLVPEPSGAVAVAAALFHREQLPPARETVAIIYRRQRRSGLAAERTR